MAVDVGEYGHPSWLTAGGTVLGYLLLMGVLSLVLFVVPWALFAFL